MFPSLFPRIGPLPGAGTPPPQGPVVSETTDDVVGSPVPTVVNLVNKAPATRNPDSWATDSASVDTDIKCENCFCPGARSRDFRASGYNVCIDCFDLSQSPFWLRAST